MDFATISHFTDAETVLEQVGQRLDHEVRLMDCAAVFADPRRDTYNDVYYVDCSTLYRQARDLVDHP